MSKKEGQRRRNAALTAGGREDGSGREKAHCSTVWLQWAWAMKKQRDQSSVFRSSSGSSTREKEPKREGTEKASRKIMGREPGKK